MRRSLIFGALLFTLKNITIIMSDLKDVFISYSTKDQQAKNDMVALFDRENITYFLDKNDLEVGQEIGKQLEDNLRKTRFTVWLVSKNSLKSPWVAMETMFRLQQDHVNAQNKLICVIIEDGILDLRFTIELQKYFKEKRAELEDLRKEMLEAGGDVEVFDIEIRRIDKVNVGDIMTKVRNHLGVVLYDTNRRDDDLKKLISTIKEAQPKGNTGGSASKVSSSSPTDLKAQALDLIDDEQYNELFALFTKNKEVFKDYQSFRERYMHDYTDYKNSEKEHFKQSLRVFVDSKKIENVQASLPTYTEEELKELVNQKLYDDVFKALYKMYDRMDGMQKPLYYQLKQEHDFGDVNFQFATRLKSFISGLFQ
jgi:hypothetical protein